jgi:hypothetical protein
VTTLVAFVAVDGHGPSAFYLASDSRITWGAPHRRWDAGRKLFASVRHPHAFGYSGDVVFPSLVLTQLVELIDTESVFADADTPEEEHSKIATAIQNSFHLRQNTPDESFSILHVSRQGSDEQSAFTLWQLSFDKGTRMWTDQRCEVSAERSSLVLAIGTGTASIRKHERSWRSSAQGGTSRAIYAAFVDSLKAGGEPHEQVGLRSIAGSSLTPYL